MNDPVQRCLQLITELHEELKKVMVDPDSHSRKEEAQKQDNRPKLSERDVKAIHDLRRRGLKVTEIADIYDVHHATISRTLRGIYNNKRGS